MTTIHQATPRLVAAMSPPDWISITTLWQHRRYWIGSTILAVVLGAIYLMVTPTTYRTEARVLVRQNGLAFEPAQQVTRPNRQFMATQAEVIRSPVVVNRALRVEDTTNSSSMRTPATAEVLKSLSVMPLAHTDVLTVFYEDTSAERCVQTLAAILESYQRHVNETERDDSVKTLELLTGREQQLREELAALQLKYEQLRNEGPIAGQGRDSLTVDMTRLRELASRIADLRRQRSETEMRLAALEAMGDDELLDGGLAAVVDDRAAGSLADLQRQLRQAQVRTQELAKTFGPLHRDRIAAKQQVTGWKQQLGDEFASLRTRLRTQRDILLSSEQELNRIYESERSKVKSLDTFLLREQQLTANIQRVVEIHQSILAKVANLELADVALADGRASVQVEILEGPTLADTPVWPQPIPLLALCGVLGSLSGAGYVAARERLAQSTAYGRQMRTLNESEHPWETRGATETHISPPLPTP